MERLEKLLRERCPELELRRDEPMSRHTSFRIGGPAALMALPGSMEQAQVSVKAARALGIEPFFLGNGSNLLVADEGYPGFILKLGGEFDEIRASGGGLEAGAAVLLSRLSRTALERGLTGLEFAGGIPGSVGGAVTMNAGAYGGEIAQALEEADFLDEAGETGTLSASECGLGYRKSIFFWPKVPDFKGQIPPGAGGPRRHQDPHGRAGREAQRKAAPGVPQRRVHVQAPPGTLCRRPH